MGRLSARKPDRRLGLVPGSWCLVLGSWFLVLRTWFLVLGRYWFPSTRHQSPSTKHQSPSTSHQAPNSLKSDTSYTDKLEIGAVNRIDSLYVFNTTGKSPKNSILQPKSIDLNTNYTTLEEKFIKRSNTIIKNLNRLYLIISKFFVTKEKPYVFFGTSLALEKASVIKRQSKIHLEVTG